MYTHSYQGKRNSQRSSVIPRHVQQNVSLPQNSPSPQQEMLFGSGRTSSSSSDTSSVLFASRQGQNNNRRPASAQQTQKQLFAHRQAQVKQAQQQFFHQKFGNTLNQRNTPAPEPANNFVAKQIQLQQQLLNSGNNRNAAPIQGPPSARSLPRPKQIGSQQSDQRQQHQTARQAKPKSNPVTEIVNAPLTALDVLISNSLLPVKQERPERMLFTSYLTYDGSSQSASNAEITGEFLETTGKWVFPSNDIQVQNRRILLQELCIEIAGELGSHDTYCGHRVTDDLETAGIVITLGKQLLTTLPIRCIADLLSYSKLKSFDFSTVADSNDTSTVLHKFVVPLSTETQISLLAHAEFIQLSLSGINLGNLQQRHRASVRWHYL